MEAYTQDTDIKVILMERGPDSFVESTSRALIDNHGRLYTSFLCVAKYFDPFNVDLSFIRFARGYYLPMV